MNNLLKELMEITKIILNMIMALVEIIIAYSIYMIAIYFIANMIIGIANLIQYFYMVY